MEARSRASPEQFVALLEFMEIHGDIARPQQGAQGRIKADRLWLQLSELLNSIGGGVPKPMLKWKKVWADWKTKTKKKALAIRREASGTGGGPSSRQTLSFLEDRLLTIMGLAAVVGQAGIEERGFDDPPSTLPPPTTEAVQENPSLSQVSIISDYIPHIQETTTSVAPPFEESVDLPSPPVPTPQSEPAPMLPVTSPIASASRSVPRWRRRPPSPPLDASPTPSTPRGRALHRARTRRIQTPFERATSEFVAVEDRRLRLEEERERKFHEREVERLRLESRRLDMEEKKNEILNNLANSVNSLVQILPQLRSSSLPSTDIIPDNQ